MLRASCRLLLLSSVLLSGGCALCASSDDYAYSTYGGRWPRQNMVQGRVGSVFHPAGGTVTVEELGPVPVASQDVPAPIPDADQHLGGRTTQSVLR